MERLGISGEKAGLVNHIEYEYNNTMGDVMQMVASDGPLDPVRPLGPADGPRETSLKPSSRATTIYYNGLERKTRKVADLVTELDPQANGSLSDSNFISRKKAILKEAEETIALEKLVGAVTIDNKSDMTCGIMSIIEAHGESLLVLIRMKELKLEDVSVVLGATTILGGIRMHLRDEKECFDKEIWSEWVRSAELDGFQNRLLDKAITTRGGKTKGPCDLEGEAKWDEKCFGNYRCFSTPSDSDITKEENIQATGILRETRYHQAKEDGGLFLVAACCCFVLVCYLPCLVGW
ncbi:hypothetical protein V6N12_005413 [Hibiscus sabdariffa]|uniref:Uncharacterized protein n=1 Tax=Hibiscus sabdariffa TaxID=183260 RepID=A0ABR2A811_9ROSI